MVGPYPAGPPHESGLLDVGDGHRVHWEERGRPDGKPALVVHGGPGAPSQGMPRLLDPAAYRIVVLHQRNCGRSTPSAADPATDLSTNTTDALIADMERLRAHLGIERWLLLGGSWGVTLALAYAVSHPDRVSELVLTAVTSGERREVEWITRSMGRIWPEAWARFRDGVPEAERDGNLAAAYARLLASDDPAVRERAARDWCAWEDTHVSLAPGWTPDPRFEDPTFRMVFARLVTHYWANDCFLPDGHLRATVGRLAGIPGVLVAGRQDVSGPPDVAWELHRAWPGSELVIVEDAGHGIGTTDVVIEATDRFARRSSGPEEG
jgi:proline iminopeptidase